MDKLGRIAFIVGLVIAAVAGFGFNQAWTGGGVLAVLGAVVGLMNVGGGERSSFMIAGIAPDHFRNRIQPGALHWRPARALSWKNIMLFVAGAIFVVAVLSLFSTAKD